MATPSDADDFAKLTVSGSGPAWHNFNVTVDGKVLPVLRLTVEIDPATETCQATIVVDSFELDLTDVPIALETS